MGNLSRISGFPSGFGDRILSKRLRTFLSGENELNIERIALISISISAILSSILFGFKSFSATFTQLTSIIYLFLLFLYIIFMCKIGYSNNDWYLDFKKTLQTVANNKVHLIRLLLLIGFITMLSGILGFGIQVIEIFVFGIVSYINISIFLLFIIKNDFFNDNES